MLSAAVLWRRGVPYGRIQRACLQLSAYSLLAILLFVVNSRWTTGRWFVGGDFFVAENEALGQPWLAWQQVMALQIIGHRHRLASMARRRAHRGDVRSIERTCLDNFVLAMAGAAAVPWYAYFNGHPLRVRYSLPMVTACTVFIATGLALVPARVRLLPASAVVAAMLLQLSPLDRTAPLIVESQRDAVNREGRWAVTEYLRDRYDGGTIMMSMGSLAHYMHDLARGFQHPRFSARGER